jgi:hypothetical protein
MSTLSNLITSAVRAVVGAPPTIHDLEATVGRSEAKIADLNLRADEAAEDGDAGAIEALEVSLSVERRLLAVATRAKAEAEARRDEAAAAEAAAAEAGAGSNANGAFQAATNGANGNGKGAKKPAKAGVKTQAMLARGAPWQRRPAAAPAPLRAARLAFF